ncbi:MAG: restriction endonuclease subunit S [Methylococcales bacterium]
MSKWQKTDFGRIPKDWNLKKVADIKGEDKRAIAMGPFGSNIKAENFVAYGVPVIRGTNLNYAKYVDGDFVYLTEEKADDLLGSNCKAGDLVFTHRGTIGQVGLIPSGKFPRYVISQSGMKLTVNPDLMDINFLFYFFKSDFGQYQILKYESQVGVPSISNPLTSLKEIEVPSPSLSEQKAIAAVLSSLDDKIDLLHRQNLTLEAMAETLFRQWFGEEAQEGWECGTLGDVAINVRSSVKTSDIQADTKYIGLEHIDRRNIALNQYGYGAEVSSKKSAFERHDILFGKLRPHFHKVCFTPFAGICSTDILVIRPKHHKYFAYCLFVFFQNDVVEYANLGSGGTRMPRTDWSILKNYPIVIPDSNSLERFNDVVLPAIKRISHNQLQIKTLEKLRDTLLPKLMCGEVQVSWSNDKKHPCESAEPLARLGGSEPHATTRPCRQPTKE